MGDQEKKLFQASHTKFSTFKMCPRKFELRYEKHIVPNVKDVKLEEGSVVHKVLELYYKGQTNLISPYFHTERATYEASIQERINKGFGSAKDLNTVRSKIETMREVLKKYFKFAPALDEDLEIKPDDVEQLFEVTTSSGIVIPVKPDALATSKKYGTLYIMEHKYTNGFSEEMMDLDFQIIMYTLAVYMKTGRIPVVIYNVIRKPQFRQGKAESPEKFLARLTKELDSLEPEELITRREYSRSKRHLDLLLEEIEGTVPMMRMPGYRYRNTGRHCQYMCPYPKICMFEDENIVKEFFDRSAAPTSKEDGGAGTEDEGVIVI